MTLQPIEAAPANVVWQSTLDEAFDVRVVRLEPSLGELSIREIGEAEPFDSKLVPFSYSAAFGPDADDVADWQAWAIDALEGRAPSSDTPHDQG